jgi:hypothetical protein
LFEVRMFMSLLRKEKLSSGVSDKAMRPVLLRVADR